MAQGKLRIYLGAAPGVGKTYAMLDEGWRRKQRGTDVVVGYVEAHGRQKTLAQIRDLEVIPRKQISYRGQAFEDMDLDAILARRPAVALIDELAHTDVPGSSHDKRWQDIDVILDAGIDVVSTLNIQHLASLNDVVERITGVTQRETVPDAVVRAADAVELVDMSPEALRRRMAHGNIYPAERVDTALGHYFKHGNLGALRELALLWVADRVDAELAAYRERHGIAVAWETKERVVVALTGAPGGERLLRRGARMARRVNGELVGVHVRTTSGLAPGPSGSLDAHRELLAELGGRYIEVTGADIAAALVNFARAENATQLVLGASRMSRWAELTRGSVVGRVARLAGDLDVHVISLSETAGQALPRAPRRHRLAPVSPRRRQVSWLLATAGILGLALALIPLRESLGLAGVLLILLLGVIAVTVTGGITPGGVAGAIAVLAGDFFFTTPYYTLVMNNPVQIVSLVVFAAVIAVVSALVDRLARRESQVVRAKAEAEALARLAGDAAGHEGLSALVTKLRRTFDLDAVAVLQPSWGRYKVVAASGRPIPTTPEDATVAAELGGDSVLVLAGSTLRAEDRRLLNAFVGQLRLVQERSGLEHQAAAAGELREANELRTAILAAVSHDLRTPLAGIKAAATSLLSKEVDWTPEDMHTLAKTIDAESDRLTQLVSNLLDMSRLQTGALRHSVGSVSVEDVLYTAVGALGRAGSTIAVDVAGEVPPVSADAGLLERTLANVMANALAWSPPGTPVRVEAAAVGGQVDVRIIDQGPGIPPAQREDVFQPFQRLGDGVGGPNGVGLGLAVARGFTEAIGGSIAIEDTPGGGTTVVITLQEAEP